MEPGDYRTTPAQGASAPASGRDAGLAAPRANEPDSPRVDVLQDELMSRHSTDGRPPPRRIRTAEWRWLGVLVPIALWGLRVGR